MRVPTAFFLLFVAGVFCGEQAWASTDFVCFQTWKLVQRDRKDICSNEAFLAPSNDTRVNLLLLMADLNAARQSAALKAATPSKYQDSPLFAWQDITSRLLAKPADTSGHTDDDGFPAAVKADTTLTPEERDALLAARAAMHARDNAPYDSKKTVEDNKKEVAAANKAASEAIDNAARDATTPSGKAFADYLAGADFFRHDSDEETANCFSGLLQADSPWLKETALYMLARTAVIRLSEGDDAYDVYGDPKPDWKPDPKLLASAQETIDNYIEAYPKGLYALSARGFTRRVYWLAGKQDQLARQYNALLAMDPKDRNVSDEELVQEIDNKLLASLFTGRRSGPPTSAWNFLAATPTLLAVFDLARMRTPEPENLHPYDESGRPYTKSEDLADLHRYHKKYASGFHPITRAEIETQKQSFAGNMPLYEYLLAAHAFFVENNPAEVLRLIPDASGQSSFSYLEFSRQMLRGLAMDALNNSDAPDFWTRMLPGCAMPFQRSLIEFALASHYERTGQVDKVFEDGSPVRYPYLRQTLLLNTAGPALLRRQATNTNVSRRERDKALFILLDKEATGGYAADFLKDVALVPRDAPDNGHGWLPVGSLDERTELTDEQEQSADALFAQEEKSPVPLGIFRQPIVGEYGCPSMVEVQTRLAKDPNDPKGLLCVADYASPYGALSDLGPLHSGELGDSRSYLPAASRQADVLGEGRPRFPGGPYVRMKAYQAVLANPKASADSKAYALYRKVKCYAPAGNNDCGGEDVPLAERRAWYMRLKKDYPVSRWAKKLKCYW